MPGPVVYQVQSGCLTLAVMSTGADHVAPSSRLCISHTVRLASLVPAMMSFSRSVPRFCVVSSQMVPVRRSMTGHGLPKVFGPLSPNHLQRRPRRAAVAAAFEDEVDVPRIARASPSSFREREQGAFGVAMTEGIRNV